MATRASVRDFTAEVEADEHGPHEVYTERLVLAPVFAKDATSTSNSIMRRARERHRPTAFG